MASYTEEYVAQLKKALAIEKARRESEERHAARCLELVEKQSRENGAVATNALAIAKRATDAEAHAAELDHQLMKTAAERDGFRARAEKAEMALNAAVDAEHSPEQQRVRELLHTLPPDLETLATASGDVVGPVVDAAELATVNHWLGELRKVAAQ